MRAGLPALCENGVRVRKTRGEDGVAEIASELLAPAGSMDALRAAVANGADAVYLGMQRFGARAYSDNFDEDGVREAVAYAHVRGVKVYATTNTIVFEDELGDVYRQLDFLNEAGVDGVIVQDLAALRYVADTFQDMEAHCSTQMGIDDLEGTLLAKELGARRVVVARELPIERVKEIRRLADVPVEVFVHGALCISYSGNCIMSGMTGNRLGNRGRCIGSCRRLFDFVDLDAGESLGKSYLLSTKDLNTVDFASDLAGIDSLKIEGRMKEPVYVANVVSRYRMALDGEASAEDKAMLSRTFNRDFTKGYLFREDRRDITNTAKPNNFGYEIGTVAGKVGGKVGGMYRIDLTSRLNQNDAIRIVHGNEEVNLVVAKLYDGEGRLVNGADDVCFVRLRERLDRGDVVYKTKDVSYYRELESRLTGEFRRFPLDVRVYAYPGAPLVVDAEGLGQSFSFASEEPLEEAVKAPTGEDAVARQFAKLNDTVFELGRLEFEGDGAFVPVRVLNEARRAVVEGLCAAKVASKPRRLRRDVAEAAGLAGDGPAARAQGGDVVAVAWAEGGDVPAAGDCLAAAAIAATSGCDTAAATGDSGAVLAAERGGAATAMTGEGDAFASRRVAPGLNGGSLGRRPYLTAQVATREQRDVAIALGVETVYFDNIVPRNGNEEAGGFPDREGELLVGGLGGIRRYRGTNPIVSDYSLNVVNSESVRELARLGVKRVTLSYEMNERQIRDLVEGLRKGEGVPGAKEAGESCAAALEPLPTEVLRADSNSLLESAASLRAGVVKAPALEMIVYGHAPLLVTKYCPLKKMGQCGSCRTKRFEIRDEYGAFPIAVSDSCNATVLNGKVVNLLDEMPSIAGVEAFRLNFTVETPDQVAEIVGKAQAKLAGTMPESTFDPATDTRGHFRRDIL